MEEDNSQTPDETTKELTGKEKRIANLKPVQKGDVGRNPWGRAGNPEKRMKGRDANYILGKRKKFKDPLEFLVAVYSDDKETLGMKVEENIPLATKVNCAKEAAKYLYATLKARESEDDDSKEVGETPTVIVLPTNERDPKKLIDESREALKSADLAEQVYIDLPDSDDD